MMIVMEVTMVKINGNDSSATTSDGHLPFTNPVTVHMSERKEKWEIKREKKIKENREMMVRG